MTQHVALRITFALMLLAPWSAGAAPSGPTITLSPPLLSFSASEGGALPAPQAMTVTNTGNGLLEWKLSSDQPWLKVTPTSGRLFAGQSTVLTVRVDATPQAESWTPMNSADAPSAREDHDAVWTGSRMVLWGGEIWGTPLNTGGLYDPVANEWVGATSLVNAPSPRTLHSMVWTGQHVIVWGGSTGASSADTYYNQGHKYNPLSDQWLGTISTQGAPSARSFHTAVWTGSRMIVWGGYDGSQRVNTGGIYDPSKNKWVGSVSTTNAPSPRLHHVAVWTGSEMIIWGGEDANFVNVNDGARYNPANNTWKPLSALGAPVARQAATAVWSGWEMILWGGCVGPGASVQTGARYNPVTDAWAAETSTENALSARQSLSAAWTGSGMILSHGAHSGGPFFEDGAIYAPPILPRGSHPAKIRVTADNAAPKTAQVTLEVGPPPVPALCVTDALPAPGSTLPGASDSILLTLNEDLEAASVSGESIRLTRAGPDGVFGTGDDIVLAPAISVVGTNQIRVDLTGIPVLNQDVRLTASGTPPAFGGRFGHWKMDEGNGVSTADASGNGRVGILENAQWAHGRIGYGLYFDGGENRVNLDAGSIDPAWTAALWVRRQDSPNVEARILDSPDIFGGTSLRLEQFNPQDRVGFTTIGVEDYFFDYIAPEDTWVHLAFVGTTTGTSLYVDGALIGTHPASVPLFIQMIGTHNVNAMKGHLDEFQIYARELSAAEVLSLARLDGTLRGSSGRVLDGEFGGTFPSGNGSSGGDFLATYRR